MTEELGDIRTMQDSGCKQGNASEHGKKEVKEISKGSKTAGNNYDFNKLIRIK